MSRRCAVYLLCLVTLIACNSELSNSSSGASLTLISDALEDAYVNEAYIADFRAIHGQTPYTFELSEGELPEGLSLSGGALSGTTSEKGNFSFTITVTDANLSKNFADFTLNVIDPPAAKLTLNVPTTEVQRTITLRADLTNVRDLQAFRSLISWDPNYFEYVPNSAKASRENVALFSQDSAGQLNVDIAILGGSLSADRRIFEFELRPIDPAFLELTTQIEFSTASGGHSYEVITEGRPVTEEFDPNQDPPEDFNPDDPFDNPENDEPIPEGQS